MGRKTVGEGYEQVGVAASAGEGLDGANVDGDDEVRVGVEVAARAEPRVEPRRCGGRQSRPRDHTDTRREYAHRHHRISAARSWLWPRRGWRGG